MVLDGLGSLVSSTVLGASGGLNEDPLRKPDELENEDRSYFHCLHSCAHLLLTCL